MEDGGYMNILSGYTRSAFLDFESSFRTEIDLVEDDIRLVLDKSNSNFVTYELDPVIYTVRDLSETLFNILQAKYLASDSKILFRLDSIIRKSNFGIIAIRFEEKSFLVLSLVLLQVGIIRTIVNTLVKKIVNLSTTKKTHLKCDIVNGSVVDGIRQPMLNSFVLDKLPGFRT